MHRRHDDGVGDLERLDQQELAQSRQRHQGDHQREVGQILRRFPEEKQRRDQDDERRQRGIGQRRHRRIAPADVARDDLPRGEGRRGQHHEEDRRVKHAESRAHDDQRADEADRHRDPAADADRLAEQDRAEHGDDERRDEGNRDRVGQRHVADRENEADRRDDRAKAAQQLGARRDAAQQGRAAQQQHDERHRGDAEIPGPGDLHRVVVGGQHLGENVGAGKRRETRDHQRDAA